MAHHQGMSLLALAHVLVDRPMQRRFESVPIFQATALLLHEKVPKAKALYSSPEELPETRRIDTDGQESSVRVFRSPNTPVPEVQLLSNGKYHVMVTNAGGGYSRWKDMAVTKRREDTTRGPRGTRSAVSVYKRKYWNSAAGSYAGDGLDATMTSRGGGFSGCLWMEPPQGSSPTKPTECSSLGGDGRLRIPKR